MSQRHNTTTPYLLDEYAELPKNFRKQLKSLVDIFVQGQTSALGGWNRKYNEAIIDTFKDMKRQCVHSGCRDKLTKKHKKMLMALALYQALDSRFFFELGMFNIAYCYTADNKDTISLKKILKTGKHAFVILGDYNGTEVVVKWYQSEKRNVEYEASIYTRLRAMSKGTATPWFSTDFYFWGEPVLVMEKLEPLDSSDKPTDIGLAILAQLAYIHQFGVHCDIKPQNMMKRVHKDGRKEFLLIDYGGVSLEPLEHGYRRWIWSPKWTSQRKGEQNQVTTAKHDFIELGYTMAAIKNWGKNHSFITANDGPNDGEFKSGHTGRLKKYMERVHQIKERSISKDDYYALFSILAGQS